MLNISKWDITFWLLVNYVGMAFFRQKYILWIQIAVSLVVPQKKCVLFPIQPSLFHWKVKNAVSIINASFVLGNILWVDQRALIQLVQWSFQSCLQLPLLSEIKSFWKDLTFLFAFWNQLGQIQNRFLLQNLTIFDIMFKRIFGVQHVFVSNYV